MTLLEAQSAIMDGLLAAVQSAWSPTVIYTDLPVLPPTGEAGERPLPEAYINLASATLDRPEHQRFTPTCLQSAPTESVRLEVEIALRQCKPQGEPERLLLHRSAQSLRTAVLMEGSGRRLFAGEPAYWLSEDYQPDELEPEALADDCLLRARFYFVVTVELA